MVIPDIGRVTLSLLDHLHPFHHTYTHVLN
jgi:hypothetical protein